LFQDPKWRLQRKYFAGTFNQAMVNDFIPSFGWKMDKVDAIMCKEQPENQLFDVIHYTELAAVEMICLSAFDIDMTTHKDAEVLKSAILNVTRM